MKRKILHPNQTPIYIFQFDSHVDIYFDYFADESKKRKEQSETYNLKWNLRKSRFIRIEYCNW